MKHHPLSPWLLPDYVADVLPARARHIENLRRRLLNTAAGYGYELVIPPLIEHLESLLTGTGTALDLQTFKLVDQLSGKTLGVRADTTPQVARIDAHLLGDRGVTRLCYCGPVLHTRPERAYATRELLQLGAEIYGACGRLADLEVLRLALDFLRQAQVPEWVLDLGDARIAPALLADIEDGAARRATIQAALVAKDAVALRAACDGLPARAFERLSAVLDLYGDKAILPEARARLGDVPAVRAALDELEWLGAQLEHCGARVGFDLADARGWGYYTGFRFAVYMPGVGDALLRGGRYDGVGAAFAGGADAGEALRPAAGFTLELKRLADGTALEPEPGAIAAPWIASAALDEVVARLRAQGEIVVRLDAADVAHASRMRFDRELVELASGWSVVRREHAD